MKEELKIYVYLTFSSLPILQNAASAVSFLLTFVSTNRAASVVQYVISDDAGASVQVHDAERDVIQVNQLGCTLLLHQFAKKGQVCILV